MKKLLNESEEIVIVEMPGTAVKDEYLHKAEIAMVDPKAFFSSYEFNANVELVSIEPINEETSVVVGHLYSGESVDMYYINTVEHDILSAFLSDVYQSLEDAGIFFNGTRPNIKYKLLTEEGAPLSATMDSKTDTLKFSSVTKKEEVKWEDVYLFIEDKEQTRTSLVEKERIPFTTFQKYKGELLMNVDDIIFAYSAENALHNYNLKLEKMKYV